VVAFGRILPPPVLALPRLGCINVHASLLPRWRGAAPIQRAILAGDRETGVAIMQMDEGLDTGAVYRMVRTAIAPEQTQGQLFERLSHVGAAALDDFLAVFPDVPPPIPQSDVGIVHAPPLTKEEGAVDWTRPVTALVDHVRGMDPWPSATCRRGDAVIKLFAATASSRAGGVPGEVLGVDAQGLHVACGDGVLCIAELQPPGKTRMPARAYAAGNAFAPGERLG
jgi:methionyl-tRNA formyltransferase